MPAHPAFRSYQLQALCAVLGDTTTGLTGSEIERLLSACRIEDPIRTMTKRHRLFEALQARQTQDRCGNAVPHFIQQAMALVSYRSQTDVFDSRRHALNEVLAFANPTGGRYEEADAKLAWSRTLAFFREHLG